jgi:rare lipoprotein A (peptidoglycan hydrolase)
MKRWIGLSLLLVPFLASAAGFWDGNAALQRGDAGFESGLYAVSNSFPPGTQITIQNQDTGKTVTATITGRIEGQSDILVLLSPKTAEALGLTQGTLGRVRVTVPSRADSFASSQAGDQTRRS